MAELDNLSIRITSDAKDASAVIDKLIENAKKLRSVMRSLEKMANGNKDASAAADNVSKSMKEADSSAKQVSKSMQEVSSAANEAKKATDSMRKAAENIKPKVDTSEIKKATATMADFQKAMTEASKGSREKYGTNLRYIRGLGVANGGASSRQQQMSEEERIRRQNEWLFGDPNKSSSGAQLPKSKQRAAETAKNGVKFSDIFRYAEDNGVSVDEASQLLKQAQEMSKAVEPIRQSAEVVSQATQGMQEELAAFRGFADTLKMSGEERKRFASIARSPERFAQAKKNGELEQFGWNGIGTQKPTEALAEAAPGQDKAAESTSRLGNALAAIKEKLSGAYGAITKYAGDMEHARISSERFVAAAGRISLKGVALAARVASGALRQLGTFAKTAGLGIASLASRVLAFPARQLRNAFNIATLGAFGKVAKSARETGGAFQSMTGGVALGLKSIMKYVLGFRTLFYLVRAIREGIAAGFKNLAAEDERTNESLSILTSKLTQVKNSLASAFAPVLNTVRPILETLINYIIDAINAVAQFFAAMTGASTWQKATYTMSDFSAGASSAGNAADGANKSAKELRKTLLSFDKINRLNDDTDSSGSGGSGGGSGGSGGGAGSGMFTTASVSTGISDFAEMVKNAWAKADFTEVGKVVGEKLAGTLNNIPWDSIQSTANKFGTSFATFINGLVSVTELANALGRTVGEAINTVFGTLNSFVSNLNFGAIGTFIADAMNAGVETIKFGTIADTIAKTVNGYFSVIGNWSGKFKFDVLGSVVGTTISSTLNGIEWDDAETALSTLAKGIASALNHAMTSNTFKSVGTAIAGGINTAVSTADSFVKEIKWDSWGDAVAAGVNKFFKDVNWANLGVSFSDAVSGLLDFLANAIEGVDWDTVGKSVVDAFAGVDWGKLFTKAAKLINVGLNAVVELVEALFKGVAEQIGKWFDENLPESVKTAIEGATKIKEFIIGTSDGSSKTENDYGTRTVNVTANMVDTKDSIPAEKKKVDGMSGNLGKVEKDSKTTLPIISGIQGLWSKITGGEKANKPTVGGVQGTWSKVLPTGKESKPTVGGVQGTWSKITDTKSTSKPAVAGIAGIFSKITANKKTKKPTVGGVKGNLTSLSSSHLSRSQRTVNVSAKVTSIDDSNLSVYMKFKTKSYGNNDANALGGVHYRGAFYSLPQYAAGGIPTHGTMFIAGESGAEAVGHINGRTEVLNRSQMASVMYQAVLTGMTQALMNSGNNNPTVVISADSKGIFKIVQAEANNYTNTTGRPAFNL